MPVNSGRVGGVQSLDDSGLVPDRGVEPKALIKILFIEGFPLQIFSLQIHSM
jgi:hypothetical protein